MYVIQKKKKLLNTNPYLDPETLVHTYRLYRIVSFFGIFISHCIVFQNVISLHPYEWDGEFHYALRPAREGLCAALRTSWTQD